jgi:Flp pilus assembly protein TadG
MTELALVLLPFLTLLFAIVEIGRAWAVKQAVTNAAREGARVLVQPYGPGLTYSDVGQVKEAAKSAAKSYLESAALSTNEATAPIEFVRQTVDADGNVTTVTLPTTDDIRRGERAGVRIRYQFETPLPVLLLSGSSPISINAMSVMQHE